MQQQIFNLLVKEEEVGWKDIIYDLIKTEQMDPMNINITLLTQKYIEAIKEMKEHNLRISGKVLLAAAFLLKLKSSHFLDAGIAKLDELLSSTEEELLDDDEFFDEVTGQRRKREQYKLIPRNPQPRNRKVSVEDLVKALQRAMQSRKRALAKIKPVKFVMPKRSVDIMEIIRDVYHKIEYYSKKEKKAKLPFTRLLPAKAGREEKVYTFIPLLHLENQHKVNMEQKKAFDEIYVGLKKKGK